MDYQIETGMEYLRKRFNAEKFIIYFQAYTNTYASVERLERLYCEALKYDDVVGLTIGTRSDCIDREKIELLENLARDFFITMEYGIESVYDKSLSFMNRGHDYRSVIDAIKLTKDRGIYIGAHIILGLPTESEDEMISTAGELSRLDIDFIKIHNLHIVRNTALARMYSERPFHLFSYEEYVDFIPRFLERLSPELVVERLFTDTPKDLLIAPLWNKSHNDIMRGIEMELEKRDTYQGRLFKQQV
jgi:hypothetical protein